MLWHSHQTAAGEGSDGTIALDQPSRTPRCSTPIEQPSKFDLVINLKTAKTLGLTIPPSLGLHAGPVIE